MHFKNNGGLTQANKDFVSQRLLKLSEWYYDFTRSTHIIDKLSVAIWSERYLFEHPDITWEEFESRFLMNPCERIINNNQKAKEYLLKPKASSRLTEIKNGISNATQEKSFSFGVKNGTEEVTSVITGTSGESVGIIAQLSDPNFKIYGGVHTHNKGIADEPSPPSFGDVYAFLIANGSNSDFKYYYTITHDENEYVFTITNPTDFSNFMTTYPPEKYIDAQTHSWDEFTEIGKDADLVMDYFITEKGKSIDESFENALAFILTKYNSGMAVSKKDNNGNFTPIFVKALPDPINPQSKVYEKTNDCNLK